MKKLQLKLDGVKQMLTKEQMKKVIGGSGEGSGGGSGACVKDGESCPASGPPGCCNSCSGAWKCYTRG